MNEMNGVVVGHVGPGETSDGLRRAEYGLVHTEHLRHSIFGGHKSTGAVDENEGHQLHEKW